MRRAIFKILILAQTIGMIMPITSCSLFKEEEEKEPTDIESISIESDIKDIRVKTDESYKSDPIIVKCFNKNKKEIKSETKLSLMPLLEKPLDISIIDNQICIGFNKSIGFYRYNLIAMTNDGKILSTPKQFQVEIYSDPGPGPTPPPGPVPPGPTPPPGPEPTKVIDSLEINGTSPLSLLFPTIKPVEYQLVGKLNGQIVESFNPLCMLEVVVNSSTTQLTKDIFGNPIFSLAQTDKKLYLHTSKNIDAKYEGSYFITLKAFSTVYEGIFTAKTVEVRLTNGIQYHDANTNSSYSRETIESDWTVRTIKSNCLSLDQSFFVQTILDKPVTTLGDNICSSSGIKDLSSIILPDWIKSIGKYAFDSQEGLSSINISNVENIDDYAFNNCPLMEANIEAQYKIKNVGKYAFSGDESFYIKNLNDIVTIGQGAFRGTAMVEVHLGSNLTSIDSEAFSDCTELANVYISTNQPPTLLGDFLGGSTPASVKIHVKASALTLYQNDKSWSIYGQKLVGDL